MRLSLFLVAVAFLALAASARADPPVSVYGAGSGGGGGGGSNPCASAFSAAPPTDGCAMGMLGPGSTLIPITSPDGTNLGVFVANFGSSGLGTQTTLAAILTALGTPMQQTGGSVSVVTGATTPTDKGGTIATGGTAQTAIASNGSRKGGWIQNPCSASEDLYVSTTGSAVTTGGTPDDADLAPCGSFSLVQGNLVIRTAVSVNAVTTSHAFIAKETQ